MNLMDRVNNEVKTWKRYYQDALKAREIVESLPDNIQQLEVHSMSSWVGTIHITIKSPEDNEEYKRIKELLIKLNGGKWLKREFIPYNGTHSLNGECDTEAGHVKFTLTDVPQPPNCEIIKKTRMTEQIYYEATCNEEEEDQTA